MATAAARAPGRGLPAAPAAPAGAAGLWAAGTLLAMSNFMVVLDTSIANVSVPHIAGNLAISPDEGTWVITSYSVAEAICVPLTGWLAARFGVVRTYLMAMAGFLLFSVLCGFSVSLTMLVACRVGQGFCGGPIMPLTQTLLLRVFPPDKRGQAMGLWSTTTVVAPIAGPLLGGWISDNLSWHWIFFINLPIAIICIFGNAIALKGSETETVRQPIDVVGLTLLVVWVGSFQVMLDLGRDRDWFGSSLIIALAIVAAIGFLAFLIWELTEPQPIVNLRVFRHRGFSASVLAMAVTYGTFFATVVVTPQWLQGSLGYTATWSGFVTAWQGLLAVIASGYVGRLVARTDPRRIFFFGCLWLAFCMYLRSRWTSGVSYWDLAFPHLLTGVGIACFFIPVMVIMLGSVEPHETASAAGMSSFLRTLSIGIATSVATTVWGNGAEADRNQLAALLQPSPGRTAMIEAQGFSAEQVRGMLSQLVDQEAFVLSLDHLLLGGGVLMTVSAVLIWLAPRPGGPVDTSQAH